jgi:hypothetical protein
MMIRELLAVTLLAVAFCGHANAEAPQGVSQTCDIWAYLVDHDRSGTNVRISPDKNSKVIKLIKSKYEESDSPSIHITGFVPGWFKVGEAIESGTEKSEFLFKGSGWVQASAVGSDGAGNGTPLFTSRSAKSKQLGVVKIEDGVVLKSCSGKWVEVENKAKNLAGWAAPNTLCTNAVTNCN